PASASATTAAPAKNPRLMTCPSPRLPVTGTSWPSSTRRTTNSASCRGISPARRLRPDHELRGVLEDLRDVGQHARAELAVDEAVVEAQRELGDLALLDLALVHPRLLAHGTEREDRGLTGVED